MKNLFKFKYPKIILLILTIIIAYYLFKYPVVQSAVSGLGKWGYISVFIAGMLFAFGFSAPFAVGFFITLNPSNLWFTGIIAGLGALTSDLIIFNFIKVSFEDEFKKLQGTQTLRQIRKYLGQKGLGRKIRKYFIAVTAGFLIASPLPDEAGVIMLAGLTKINQFALAILSFTLNTLGIIFILSL